LGIIIDCNPTKN